MAVGIGLALDIGGTLIFSLVIGVVWAITLAVSGMGPEEIQEQLSHSTSMMVISLVMGLVFTAMGGFFAALIAEEDGLLNSLAVGACGLGFGLALTLAMPDQYPPWFTVSSFLLTVPAAGLGGHIGVSIK